jgi:hypothetical protein
VIAQMQNTSEDVLGQGGLAAAAIGVGMVWLASGITDRFIPCPWTMVGQTGLICFHHDASRPDDPERDLCHDMAPVRLPYDFRRRLRAMLASLAAFDGA